jgi:hypothetical protein
MFRIVFSDIDGTLLNGNRELSASTIQQVERITREHHAAFILVSARMPSGIKHLHDQLQADGPAICYNGALILNRLTGVFGSESVLFSTSIEHHYAAWLNAESTSAGLHCSIYSNDNWFTSARDYWTIREERNTKVHATICDVEDVIKQLQIEREPIHKIMVMGDADRIEPFRAKAEGKVGGKISLYRSKSTYLELTPASVSKASACAFLLEKLQVPREEAIAFGDNYNDIDMLRLVGLGIAMDNAPDEVKGAAKRIAPPNHCDGVARLLQEVF